MFSCILMAAQSILRESLDVLANTHEPTDKYRRLYNVEHLNEKLQQLYVMKGHIRNVNTRMQKFRHHDAHESNQGHF